MLQEAVSVPLSRSFKTSSVCCLAPAAPIALRDLRFSPLLDGADG